MFHEALSPVFNLHLKCLLYDATADCIVKINKPIQFAPELYSAACFVPKDDTSSIKVNVCGAAATLATKADGVAMWSKSSPISLFVSSNGKGDLMMVFTYVTYCGTASSVTFRI